MADIRLSVSLGSSNVTEMAFGLTLLRSSEEKGVGSLGSLHDQLVESHARAAGSFDACASCFGETESSYVHLREVIDTMIISHGGNNNYGAIFLFSEMLDSTAERYWGSHGS